MRRHDVLRLLSLKCFIEIFDSVIPTKSPTRFKMRVFPRQQWEALDNYPRRTQEHIDNRETLMCKLSLLKIRSQAIKLLSVLRY